MNGTRYKTADAQTTGSAIPVELFIDKEQADYQTMPLVVVRPIARQISEEEIYTSFEAAISDRVLAMQSTLSRLRQAQAARRPAAERTPWRRDWLRATRFAVLALLCMLFGFDLMGLLVLLVR